MTFKQCLLIKDNKTARLLHMWCFSGSLPDGYPLFHACCRLYLNVPLTGKKRLLFGTTKKGDDHDDTGQYDSHLDGLRPLQ